MTELSPEKAALKQPKIENNKNLERQPISTNVDIQTPKDQAKQVEAAREKLKTSQEKPLPLQPSAVEKKLTKPVLSDPAALKQAYQSAITNLRANQKPAERAFSKLIHVRPVEVVSELLEETFYRPSFLWGGTLGGLVFGGGLYLLASTQGYPLSGSEFTVGLIGGGCLGIGLEKLWRLFRPTKLNH